MRVAFCSGLSATALGMIYVTGSPDFQIGNLEVLFGTWSEHLPTGLCPDVPYRFLL